MGICSSRGGRGSILIPELALGAAAPSQSRARSPGKLVTGAYSADGQAVAR